MVEINSVGLVMNGNAMLIRNTPKVKRLVAVSVSHESPSMVKSMCLMEKVHVNIDGMRSLNQAVVDLKNQYNHNWGIDTKYIHAEVVEIIYTEEIDTAYPGDDVLEGGNSLH